jgi:hypothetical protein
MKKRIVNLILILSVAAASSVFAAGSITFDTVCARLAQHPNTTGDFTQVKKISAANRLLKSSGTFIFSLEGIMWKTEKPFPSTLVVGMTSVIQTTPDGKKTVIDASNNQIFTSISTTLSSIFSGDTDKLYSSFNVNFSVTGSEWTAVLTPRDKTITAVMKSLTLGGKNTDSSTEFNSIVMTEAGGDTITYTFFNQQYPKELSNDQKADFTAK